MKPIPAAFAIALSLAMGVVHADDRDDRYHDRSGRGDYVGRSNYSDGAGPFTPDEARALRAVWSRIREAENFSDINWRSVGLKRAPGGRDARSFMAADWQSLRRADNFDDINWRAEYRRR
jgi:hypothetical protein